MRVSYICSHCGHKQIVKYSQTLLIFITLTIIGLIPWGIWFYNKTKCPKCKCIMDKTSTIQKRDFGKAPSSI